MGNIPDIYTYIYINERKYLGICINIDENMVGP